MSLQEEVEETLEGGRLGTSFQRLKFLPEKLYKK